MAKADEEEFEQLDYEEDNTKVINKARQNTSMLQASVLGMKRPKKQNVTEEKKERRDSKKHPKSFNQLENKTEK